VDADGALSMHNEFSMLNLADLLLARERNHVELMRKDHVVGTAVGLYLIRKSEPWEKRQGSARAGSARRARWTILKYATIRGRASLPL
jgi:hypothetical protein